MRNFHCAPTNKIQRGHAIGSLKKSNIHLVLRDIPADKLEKLGEMLAELKSDDKG